MVAWETSILSSDNCDSPFPIAMHFLMIQKEIPVINLVI